MFKVWFAKGYANEELLGEFKSEGAAMNFADFKYDLGTRDIEVYDQFGAVIYEPTEEKVFDEF